MKIILILNFLMLTFFNFAHPVTPTMMVAKDLPDALFGLLFMMMSLGTFLFSPIWGNKIDMTGTKRIMVMAPIGYLIGQVIFAYSYSSLLMMLARLLSGIFASAWIVGVITYINLVSDEEAKIKNFGYQMVTAYLGGIVGQTLSGYVGSEIYMHSFYVQFIGLFAVSILALFFLKDLYPEKKVTEKTSFKSSIKIIRTHKFGFIMLSMIMISMVSNTFMSTIAYFGSDVLGFDPIEVGRLNSYISLLGLLANLFLIKLLADKLNFYASFSLQGTLALVSGLLIVVLLGFNFNFILFLVAITLLTLASSMYRPFVQTFMINSKKFNPGEVLGVITSLNAIGMVGGSLTFSVFYATNEILPFIMILFYASFSILFLLVGKHKLNMEG